MTQPHNDKKANRLTGQEKDQLTLEDIGVALVRALHNTQSGRHRIESGHASLSRLPEPVATRYGTSTHVYRYTEGCRPVTELNRGVQAIFFTASDPGGEELTFSIGKSPEMGPDMYRFTGNRTNGETSELVVERLVPEAEITAPLVRLGACRLSEVLPASVQEGAQIDLATYNVQAIHGLIDHPGGRR